MERRLFLLTLALSAAPLLPTPLLQGGSADGRLTGNDRARLLESLESGRAELLAAVAGMSDEAWSYRPAAGRWSPAEIMEHLQKSEGLFQTALDGALAGEPNAGWRATVAKTDELEAMMLDRSSPAQAPPVLQPEQALSRTELVSAFAKDRAAVIAYVRSVEAPIKTHTGALGPWDPVNGMQLILLRGAHTHRHLEQLREVIESPGFPR